MNKITEIKYNQGKNKDRVYIFINDKYCASVRKRTFDALEVQVGDIIDCNKLKEKESYIWKLLYKNSWEDEKRRIQYVKSWLNKYIPHLKVEITGFGANSKELIKQHPEEKGEPDLTLFLKNTKTIILFLEVTGTYRKKGDDFWVRPDKIDYIQKHKDKDIWIALHYELDKKIIWLKPSLSKKYDTFSINLKGADENYVSFTENSKEVKSSAEFRKYVLDKIGIEK